MFLWISTKEIFKKRKPANKTSKQFYEYFLLIFNSVTEFLCRVSLPTRLHSLGSEALWLPSLNLSLSASLTLLACCFVASAAFHNPIAHRARFVVAFVRRRVSLFIFCFSPISFLTCPPRPPLAHPPHKATIVTNSISIILIFQKYLSFFLYKVVTSTASTI